MKIPFFKKKHISEPHEGMRQYEWRYNKNNRIYGKPEYAKNACFFYIKYRLNDLVSPRSKEEIEVDPLGGIGMYVTLTGEKILTAYEHRRCRLANDPEAEWFKV